MDMTNITKTNAGGFDSLGLHPLILSALARENYTVPTPIQAQAIPSVVKGRDLLGIAQTGTGKTAAFALPILNRLISEPREREHKAVRVLVLSPTRELASQIADSFTTYGQGLGFKVAAIYGGVKYAQQYKALSGGLDILVATPGRLWDHLEQKSVDLSMVQMLVLDEADQMLDMGFIAPIRAIVKKIKAPRQNLFFSATMPREVEGLVKELLHDPVTVEITPQSTTAEKVSQEVLFIEQNRKRALLCELFADPSLDRVLVFARTKHGADRVAAYLQSADIGCAVIHGEKSQSQRERALLAFKDGRLRALVATDIAARGLDIDRVSHVINIDLPMTPEAYVHRIGRTARAGQTGKAISLCADDERNKLKAIQRMIRMNLPTFDRRKDKALAVMDDAMIAQGIKAQPDTPERLNKPKSDRSEKSFGRGRDSGRGARRGPRPDSRPDARPDAGRDFGAEPRLEAASDFGHDRVAKPDRAKQKEALFEGHFDPDANFVHKRSRPKPAQFEGKRPDSKYGDSKKRDFKKGDGKVWEDRAAKPRPYDPLAAEKPPAKASDRPARGPQRPDDRPKKSFRPKARTGQRAAASAQLGANPRAESSEVKLKRKPRY
jgi:ATP-dependent RNA helicase RhlE